MKTLDEFWERLRCAGKIHLTMQEAEDLEIAIDTAKHEDFDKLKLIAYRVLRGFKVYYLETRKKEQENSSSCSCGADLKT